MLEDQISLAIFLFMAKL